MKKIIILFNLSTLFFALISTRELCFAQNSVQQNKTKNKSNNSIELKTKTATRTTSFPLCTITFGELLNDLSTTVLHSAYLKIKAVIGGFVNDVQTEIIYLGEICVLPGATSTDPAILTVINESSATLYGTPVTITSSISGTGTTAILTLNNSVDISQQEISFSFDIVSNNIASLN